MSAGRRHLAASLCILFAIPLAAQQYSAEMLSGLEWRDVGPMRGGRTYAVSGNVSQPDTFYMGSVGGGVWKTENSGRTWFPIADDPVTGIPIGSIGAIAVAPSDPNIIYVGTGEPDIRSQHSYGIGMFKSTDAGKTWHSIGLAETRQIGKIVVDPADPNNVYVAALGHVYKANPERGVYRSTDGGAHWKKILASEKDPDSVGAIDLALDPQNPKIIYASLWATRRPPWSVYAPSNMPGGGLYKSIDGGDTWHELTGGLPNDDFVGKIGIAIAPSNSKRLYAVVDDLGTAIARGFRAVPGAEKTPTPKPTGGIYLSDDAGASWRLVNNEQRLWGRGWYFGQITVDPRNPDRAYDINTATYMTLDAGKTWVPVKGAPGGDDYHQLWINPKDGNRMVLSSDQGTVVSVDGAETWSTWYNQPTAQVYHLAADNRFPYWLYGAQQDSGGVGVSTWSRMSTLSFRNWEPTCEAGESSTVVPDPDNGNFLYGNGDHRCNQGLNLPAPAGGELPAADPSDPERRTWTLPQVFSPADKALYYADQFVFRTRDRGKTWAKISPDLTRLHPDVPKTLDPVTAKDIDQQMTDRFGVVYTISPSPLDAKTIWVGTDDGLIHVSTDDGANWKDVTPPPMSAWSKVSQIEASHFDVGTAFASVDRHRLADDRPYIYRTHDGGKTWKNIVEGIPEGAFVNSIKEDTKQKDLLYAATELRVYVSFNDGDHWQPLQLNMPVTSVRDIDVHGDDLAVATFGRGFWVLDQMSALRQIASRGTEIEASPAFLFTPGESLAIHQGSQNGTPLPHEEPQEKNPPAGVVAYYWLKSAPSGPLKLELVDATGKVAACVASDTPVKPVDTEAINVQAYWLEPVPPPSSTPGMHRAVLNVISPRGFGGRQISLPPKDACHPAGAPAPKPAAQPSRPSRTIAGLQPGDYTVRLTVGGQTLSQPVTVKPDPRQLPKGADASPDDDDDR
ncbi:hypothetical protein P8935_01990 [Telmatobacter sp. DSM 110680]|uniref:Sortilin N-terminal domain-containing protein n=1 Tax=Telmatobacter sp. DSM 110680 TaxID=3036704 RepID=A0AAU7DLB4_9BACT